MLVRTASYPLLLTAALGLLITGCPGKDDSDPNGSSDTGAATATSTEATPGTDPTTGTSTDPTGDITSTGPSTTDTSTSSTTTTSTTTGDTTTDTGEPDPLCDCIDVGEFGNSSYSCGAGACGLINPPCVPDESGTSDDGGDEFGDEFGDEGGGIDCTLTPDAEQIDCALDLLIAGEPAVVKWRSSTDQGFSEYGGFVQILPERQGLTRSWQLVDIGGEESAAGFVALRPAAYFEGCKDLSTARERFYCMRDWTDEEPGMQCDEPGTIEDF